MVLLILVNHSKAECGYGAPNGDAVPYRLTKERFARVRVEMQMMRCLEPMTAIIT